MIIDSHSHVGHDWMMSPARIEDYDNILKENGICAGILMPEPGHINEMSGKRILLWKFEGKGIYHYSPHYDSDSPDVLKKTSKIINDEIYSIINNYKTKHRLFFFVPMIHPIVDDVQYYRDIKTKYNCVALKMHGIAGGYAPEMIDDEHIKAIRETGLPLIIHTDYDLRIETELGRIRNMNTPRRWLDFLRNNQLRGYLCHGCRMDISVLKEIADLDGIVVGLGPDRAIQENKNRLYKFADMNYLNNLINILPSDKLLFDIDYNYLEGDRDFVRRVKSVFPESDLEKVFSKNAISFFGLDEAALVEVNSDL